NGGPDETSVVLVEKAIKLATTPRDAHLEPGFDRGECPPHGVDRQATAMPSLDQRDGGLTDASRDGQILLAPAFSKAQRTKHAPEPDGVHPVQDHLRGSPEHSRR